MSKENELSIISLGGKGEVGSNMIVLEYQNDIIVLDTGTLFPENDCFGIDLIIPDFSYLINKQDKIRGFVFSHGHEDHIGAIPYIMDKLKAPLYGTDLTMGLIESKLNDFGLDQKADLNVIEAGKSLKLGCFEIEFCHVNHSIPGSVAMGIHTPEGLIVYTGDYKFDQTPVNNPQTDYEKLSDWGQEGVLLLLGDSTNSEREGHSLSERVVAQNLNDAFKLVQQRIIISTFSTNIHRIQHIFRAGQKAGRKVAVVGRSMLNTIEIAARTGYLKIPDGMLITINEAEKLDPDKVILLMTGSQGERGAALTRISRDEHRNLKINPGDTVFLSATPIPGNEVAVGKTMNKLFSQGAEVIYHEILDVHATGHACREELKMMINLTKPTYLVPVHGEFRHLYHHAQLGKDMGIPVENIYIVENGKRINLTAGKLELDGDVSSGKIFLENNKIMPVDSRVLDSRKKLASNGFICIIIKNKDNSYQTDTEFITRGYMDLSKKKALLHKAKSLVTDLIKKANRENIGEWPVVKREIVDTLNNYFYQKENHSPLILPELINI